MTGPLKTLVCIVLLPALLAACSAPAQPPNAADITDQRVFLVGFSPNAEVRRLFEDDLEVSLVGHDVKAVQSHLSIPAFEDLEHDRILAAADAQDASLILMVRRLAAEGERHGAGLPEPPARDMRAYRTLQDFLTSYERRPPTPPPPGRQVVEVYGYSRDEAGAHLIWSGYSWVAYDGNLERAIHETAELIADNMAQSRDAVRATLRDNPQSTSPSNEAER